MKLNRIFFNSNDNIFPKKRSMKTGVWLLAMFILGLGEAWGQDSITCVFRCTGIGTSQTYYLAHTNEAELSSTNKNVFAETEFNPMTCRWHFKPAANQWSSSKFFPLRKNYPPGVNGDKDRIQAQLAGEGSGNAFRGATYLLSLPLYYFWDAQPAGQKERYVAYNPSTSIWELDNTIADEYKTYAYKVTAGAPFSFLGLTATLSGDEIISSSGTYRYSYTYIIDEMTCTDYHFTNSNFGIDEHHYWYDNTDHLNDEPSDWDAGNVTATWSLSSNAASYASWDETTEELTVNRMPAGNLLITLTCTFTDGTHTLSFSKDITLTGLYLLMDNDCRIVKRQGTNSTLLSSMSFTPEGTFWTFIPYRKDREVRHYYKANSESSDCYLSLAGWVSAPTSAYTRPTLKITDTPTDEEGGTGLSDGEIKMYNQYTIYWDTEGSQWKVMKSTVPDNRVRPYEVAYSEGNYPMLSAMLSGNSVVTTTGSYPITLDTATIDKTYELYQYNNTSHYWYDRADHDTAPVDWGTTVSTTWSMAPSVAGVSINSTTGQLTVISMPATDTEVVITCTITDNAGHTITLRHNVLLTTATLSNVLTIEDRENHSWSYYAGTDIEGYNNRYLGTLYSPQPRDVKITYMGNDGAVSSANVYPYNETEENIVYYKTLEQGSVEGEYPYALIPNPFSKRPKVNNVVQGFAGWKIVSGGHYIQGYSNGDTLSLELGHKLTNSLTLVNLPDGTEENTMAHIVFEATWTNATVKRIDNSYGGDFTFNATTAGSSSVSGTYETNLLVITSPNFNYNITAELPVTVMQVEPDGSADYREDFEQLYGTDKNFTGRLIPANDQMTKMEFVKWAPSNSSSENIDLGGKSYHLGRGIIRARNRNIRGSITNDLLNQTIRIESGKFNYFYPLADGTEGIPIDRLDIVLGCDYDRAKNNHDNFEVVNSFMLCNGDHAAKALGEDKVHIVVKSGKHQTGCPENTGEHSSNSFYISNPGSSTGTRDLLIEGGILRHVAGGAMENKTFQDKDYTRIRIKGGKFLGCVFGGAAKVENYGSTKLVITGGQFNSWVAGAANGTKSDGQYSGITNGRSYLYVGGNAHVGAQSDEEDIRVNAAQGGNVFGAGCGNSACETGGQIQYGSNVVIADSAYIRRGVYGGGAYAQTLSMANVYILNGKIEAEEGYVYPTEGTDVGRVTISGGVYGGAALKGGGSSNVVMVNGKVLDNGIFGGSNYSGAMTGNTTVTVKGGSKVYGSVFGGGEKGKVNGNTTVNLEGNALVTGSAFAAGKGDKSDGGNIDAGEVLGNTTLNLSENAWVKYCVYGGGEIANVGRTVSNLITIPIAGSDVEVTIKEPVANTGITTVNISGGTVGVERNLTEIGLDHNSCHVFGAGKGSPEPDFNMWTNVNETRVNITGGRIYGSVFGGSDVGHVLGDINIDVNMSSASDVIGTFGYSEIDGNIFGGGHGYVSGEFIGTESVTAGGTQGNVNIHVQGEGTILGSVFGGGRIASTGIVLCENDDDPETPDAAGEPIPDVGAQTYGHVEILVEGNVKIGHDPIPGYLAGEIGGNVYGGAMGVDENPST